jgi:hypothetical protein
MDELELAVLDIMQVHGVRVASGTNGEIVCLSCGHCVGFSHWLSISVDVCVRGHQAKEVVKFFKKLVNNNDNS